MELGEGSVYANEISGDEMVIYQQRDGNWIAESNRFDAQETTKAKIMKKIKAWGYTKFVGYESLCE